MLKQMKKTLGILLVVCFLMSVTAAAASAHGGGWGRWGGYPWMGYSYPYLGNPYAAPYIATVPVLAPTVQEAFVPIVTCWPAQVSAAAVSAGSTIVKEKKKATSKAVSTRPTMVKEKKKAISKAVSTKSTMVKEKKKATSDAVSAHGDGWSGECDCGCDCDGGSFIDTFIDIFIHCLPCNENCTSENCTSENCTL